MEFLKKLPDWLIARLRIALLGEIYANIRAIAVGYDNDGKLVIRYYLDREPDEFDFESAAIVSTNLDALGGSGNVNVIEIECFFSKDSLRDLDPLSGFFFARRE